MGHCVGLQSGHRWKALRLAFEPYFTNYQVCQIEDILSFQVKAWFTELVDKQFSDTNPTSVTIEALDLFKLLPFKVISLACFGELLFDATNFERLLKLVSLHDKVFANATFSKLGKYSFFSYIPWLSINKELRQYKREWENLCLDFLKISNENGITSIATETFVSVQSGKITNDEWLQSM